MKNFIILLFSIQIACSYGQSSDSLVSELKHMKATSLDCSAETYWRIIQRGKASIPFLIEGLTDTTPVMIYDKCKKAKLNVGEVCYFALQEIADFPAFSVTHIQFDVITDDCWSFMDYLFDNKNKPSYQSKVKAFYAKEKYRFQSFKPSELNECQKKYRIKGRYTWKG
jgi:hypothetical protein